MRGEVFHIRTRETNTGKFHWHVVLADEDDFVVVLAIITSKIDIQKELASRTGAPQETIVEFAADNYAPLTMRSCINCNRVFRIARSDFEEAKRVAGRRARGYPPFPERLLEKVYRGVKASREVSPKIKAIIWG